MAHPNQTDELPPVIPHSEPAGGTASLEAAMVREKNPVKRFFKLLGPGLITGASDDDLRTLIASTWTARADRGAEERLALADRGALYQIDALRADPRREMHTRGG